MTADKSRMSDTWIALLPPSCHNVCFTAMSDIIAGLFEEYLINPLRPFKRSSNMADAQACSAAQSDVLRALCIRYI